MVFFWLKTIYDDNIKMTDAARAILDPARTYYKLNNQEDVPIQALPSFPYEPSEEHLKFIADLKEGDLIDCVKVEPVYKKYCWSHAKVIHVMDSHIKVTY
mmetsp:Transcript_29246/g.26680  ORF Transcript_29246/g.26680 Transcript_29246/m.26680 type:complete len:100 (+) Transcript_29246:359-658(+)